MATSGNDGTDVSAVPAFRCAQCGLRTNLRSFRLLRDQQRVLLCRVHMFSCQTACCARQNVRNKESRPLFGCFGPGGRPHSCLFASPSVEGVGAPTGRWPGLLQTGMARLATGPGREASRPAPCGAPTRHLGLYAFDGGRTGPAHSGRRGCPSTARGRGLRKSPARGCRSRSPPCERLRKAPLELGSG
jgi:hypothetical protein